MNGGAVVAKALVGSREEGLVSSVIKIGDDDRTAQDAAEEVITKLALLSRRRCEPALRIHRVVLNVVIRRAMEVIGTGPRNKVDVNTEVVAVLRGVVSVLCLYCAQCVGIGRQRGSCDQVVHDRDAIE